MPLDFIRGEPEGTSKEAVAFVTDDSGVATDYNVGEVAGSISKLVVINGPEDVIAYVNDAASTLNEIAEIRVSNNEVVLDVGAAGAAADANSVAIDGGLFLSPDDFDENDEYEATLDDGTTQVVSLADGIPLVVQASGY